MGLFEEWWERPTAVAAFRSLHHAAMGFPPLATEYVFARVKGRKVSFGRWISRVRRGDGDAAEVRGIGWLKENVLPRMVRRTATSSGSRAVEVSCMMFNNGFASFM